MRVGLSLLMSCCLAASCAWARERVSFNDGWRFARFGAMPDGSQLEEPSGLEKVNYDDSGWRVVNLPHDWGIEGPFRDDLPNRTGKLPWAGIGWYRKTFRSEESDRGKRVFIDFDGAMSDARVWLNGQYVGRRPYGYSSFRLDLTDRLKPGRRNTIAVRLDNPPESSRWYPGGGLYRNVWLVKTAPVHVAHWGVCVTTPKATRESATVEITTRLDGPARGVRVRHDILTEEAEPTVAAQATASPGAPCRIELASPRLWSPAAPNLYRVKTTILKDGNVVDDYHTVFGVRAIEYNAERGFLLNGEPVRMHGVCLHHDLGPLGTAVNRRALERQIEILQRMGCNAIRTSHNPPAPELLDLCDRMGMLVMDEAFDCWKKGKTPNDYARYFPQWHEKDLSGMVRRDRNHPCVVLWSTGNEIREQSGDEGLRISRSLADIVRRYDRTRPVTAGCNNAAAGMNGFQKTVDVFGYNYKPHLYESFRKANPDQPLFGSETASTVSSRGEYFFPVSDDKSKGLGGYFQVSSYDLYAPKWAYPPDVEFAAQDKCPWVFGQFVWTGFDYLGEPTPYNKDATNLLNVADPADRERMSEELDKLDKHIPSRSSYFGIVDLCGFPKDRYYLYQARWRPDSPMVHILPHWNWPERVGKTTPVHVYTSGDEAELFLNGKSLGRKKKGQYEYRLRWDRVIYEPGRLKAVAYKNGEVWAISERRTTGKAARLQLSPDRSAIAADGRDLSFVTVRITDADGLLVPRSHNRVKYSLVGPGEIVAIGNGDPTSHESFQALQRKVFNGLALVIVRSKKDESGRITLRAESSGLRSAATVLESQ